MKQLKVNCHHYRSKWGHINLFTSYFIKKLCLFNGIIQDWKNYSDIILSERLIKQCNANSMICLQDVRNDSHTDKGAPLNTISALDLAIPKLKTNTLNFIAIERSQL